jgi:DNA-binding winged helix-turn-helix (wHTH) protein
MRIFFGDFEIDSQRFSLSRNGRRVPLRPKVFDLLIYLLANRERVVSREELVGSLWGRTIVGSGSLSGLVNELRKSLGERGHVNSSIRTVHARGYQFVAEAFEESPGLESEWRAMEPGPGGDRAARHELAERPFASRVGPREVRALFEARGIQTPPADLIEALCEFVANSEQFVDNVGQQCPESRRSIRSDQPQRRMRLARSDSTSPRTRARRES